MIRCMMVEDEPLAQDILSKYISETEGLELVYVAKDGKEAFEQIDQLSIDLIFLDINLPKISGINLYKSLRKKPKVIFTTAYPDYAVEGFELEAIDYLVKPFSFDRFMNAIARAKKSLDEVNSVLLVKDDKKIYRIDFADILYIESIRDYAKIHTNSGVHISSDTLKILISKLSTSQFIRTHKSYIVSMSAIDYLEGNQLIIGSNKIPIGASYREDVFRFFKK